MVEVEFLGPIGIDSMSLDISNLSQLSEVLKNEAKIAPWLKDCAVAVNDTLVSSKDIILNSGDRVSLLPPVCGG